MVQLTLLRAALPFPRTQSGGRPVQGCSRKGHPHLFHSHLLLLSYSVLRGGQVHVNNLLSGPAPFDEHLGLKVEGADAVGRIEGHAVLQAAAVGQELRGRKRLSSDMALA